MNEELQEILQTNYRYAIEAQAADDAEAEVAHGAGEMAAFFDLSLHLDLADTCWALERWDESRHWYRHNARVLMDKRAWHAEHSGSDYPHEAISDWEAATLVKAGDLRLGREHLKRAIPLWEKEPGSSLVLTKLGLHAAQAGLSELAPYALRIIDARQELPGGSEDVTQRVRQLLHYEPAQVSLMLGNDEAFFEEVEKVDEAARLVEGKPGDAFPGPMQDALRAAARGLRVLAALKARKTGPEGAPGAAREAFEEAMVHFYRFSDQVDWNLYFMRLNTRFADELASGQPPNPNPFADGDRTLSR